MGSNPYTNLAGNKWNGSIDGSSLNVSGTVFTGNVNNQFRFKNDQMWAINTGVQKNVEKNEPVGLVPMFFLTLCGRREHEI